ncbi:MAG: adenylate/guanylate cyclase domain-containing protein [Alphaproteobacteria bacterium]|nr:adenylate/guanylate cyclase domain-containing protein [Alphaproteobacteria bacterium]
MAEQRAQRRLAAILAADVVGYSRLMRADEAGTLAQLNAIRRELLDPKIAEYGGRIVKTTGDGILIEFPSAVDAVQQAIDVQQEMARRNADIAENQRMEIRMGINVGDVIVEDDDLFGDGVNVAARLEGLAEPGGICISGNAYEQVRDKLQTRFEDMGAQEVKNIDRPVQAYRVSLEPDDRTEATSVQSNTSPLPLPDKSSIAVLPFQNMSGDPDQEYFSDGITADIITALSHIRQFFVIARNTTFTYKGRAVEVPAIARELGVRYVLEGSVRKAGNRVRVTAQLIHGETGNHIWAERYDRSLEDIFGLQDEITQMVVGAIEPELDRAERERAIQTPPENLDAWEYLHRGWWHLIKFEKSEIQEAQNCFHHAVEIDSSFAQAYAGLAEAEFMNLMGGFVDKPIDSLEQGFEAANKAVALDGKDSVAHATLGVLHLARREHALAIEALQRALIANPSSAKAHHWLGLVFAFYGRPDDAIAEQELATRLSPNDPWLWAFMNVRSYAYLHSNRLEQAVEWAHRSLRQPSAPRAPYIVYVIALSHLDRRDEAERASETLLEKFSDTSIAKVRNAFPFSREEDLELWIEGLRKAGLPE